MAHRTPKNCSLIKMMLKHGEEIPFTVSTEKGQRCLGYCINREETPNEICKKCKVRHITSGIKE